MKTLLIYPYFLDQRLDQEDMDVIPQGLYYLAAFLQSEGIEVEVMDLHGFRGRSKEIRRVFDAVRPDLIGFTVLHGNRWGAMEITKIAKAAHPKAPIVFGGVGATFLWELLLRHFPEIDYIVLGEGEYTLLELARALDSGDRSSIPGIPGLAFRDGERPVRTGSREPIPDLDVLPHPARNFTYRHLLLSRGCPGRCTFCGSPGFWPGQVRSHSVEYFLEELEMLSARGVGHFFISDDTFTLDSSKVEEICRGIIERRLPITWQAISRVDRVDEDILYWMRKAGCIQISYGVESGAASIRKRLGKPLNEGEIRRAFSLTSRFGILPRAYFIYGSPGETPETIQATLDLIEQIRPLAAIFYMLTLFPGTALAREFLQSTGQSDEVWLERTEDMPYCLTDPELTTEQVKEYGRTLRHGFHVTLSRTADSIELEDMEDLHPLHADFLSRLGMTFHRGDYSRVEAVTGKASLARRLYSRALGFHPNPRAFLGLGMLDQESGDAASAEKNLREGLRLFPDDMSLGLCFGILLMNQGGFEEAMEILSRFRDNPDIRFYLDECRRMLGRRK